MEGDGQRLYIGQPPRFFPTAAVGGGHGCTGAEMPTVYGKVGTSGGGSKDSAGAGQTTD